MRVALADDSALFRQGLALLLTSVGLEVVLEAATGDELLSRLPDHPADVVILDIRMPPTFTDEGLAAAEEVRVRHPSSGVLVLSTYAETSYAVRLLRAGSRGVGYLLKDRVDDIATLSDALSRVVAGEAVIDPDIVTNLVNRQTPGPLATLTSREREILRLMAEGRSNIGIARLLFLSPKTVEAHTASLFAKLAVPGDPTDNRRVLAVLTWLRSTPPSGNLDTLDPSS